MSLIADTSLISSLYPQKSNEWPLATDDKNISTLCRMLFVGGEKRVHSEIKFAERTTEWWVILG